MNVLSNLEMKLRYYHRLTFHQKWPLVRIPTSNGAVLSGQNGQHREVNQQPNDRVASIFHCATQVSVVYSFVFAYFWWNTAAVFFILKRFVIVRTNPTQNGLGSSIAYWLALRSSIQRSSVQTPMGALGFRATFLFVKRF